MNHGGRGDGDVDLAWLLATYGACEGAPGYYAKTDLDGSGCVDFWDLLILLSNYGAGG